MIYKGGQYKPFSESEVGRINESVITLLEKGGVKVFTKAGREAFKKAGAEVSESDYIVKISQSMLEDAIASAP